MTVLMQASLASIGRKLQAKSLRIVAEPLPMELKSLVAQLAACDVQRRATNGRTEDVANAAIVPPDLQS